MSFPAQAQTTSICDRTPQVVDEILKSTSDFDFCNSVRNSRMARISTFSLRNRKITSLQSGDFDGLTGLIVLILGQNNLTELPAGIFSSLPNLVTLALNDNFLTTLPSDVFSNNGRLTTIILTGNQLNNLPDGIFSGLPLSTLSLSDNPGAPFQLLRVRFEPETLEEDFTAEAVRLVSDKTAPLAITVPLSVTGGRLMEGAPDSLTIPEGSTQSDTVTVLRGEGYFRLAQEEPQLGSLTDYSGIEVVRGPSIILGGIQVRARVFLEGALE